MKQSHTFMLPFEHFFMVNYTIEKRMQIIYSFFFGGFLPWGKGICYTQELVCVA